MDGLTIELHVDCGLTLMYYLLVCVNNSTALQTFELE